MEPTTLHAKTSTLVECPRAAWHRGALGPCKQHPRWAPAQEASLLPSNGCAHFTQCWTLQARRKTSKGRPQGRCPGDTLSPASASAVDGFVAQRCLSPAPVGAKGCASPAIPGRLRRQQPQGPAASQSWTRFQEVSPPGLAAHGWTVGRAGNRLGHLTDGALLRVGEALLAQSKDSRAHDQGARQLALAARRPHCPRARASLASQARLHPAWRTLLLLRPGLGAPALAQARTSLT